MLIKQKQNSNIDYTQINIITCPTKYIEFKDNFL